MTRLDLLWNVFATNFRTKAAQITLLNFNGTFWKWHCKIKTSTESFKQIMQKLDTFYSNIWSRWLRDWVICYWYYVISPNFIWPTVRSPTSYQSKRQLANHITKLIWLNLPFLYHSLAKSIIGQNVSLVLKMGHSWPLFLSLSFLKSVNKM